MHVTYSPLHHLHKVVHGVAAGYSTPLHHPVMLTLESCTTCALQVVQHDVVMLCAATGERRCLQLCSQASI